MNSTSKAPVRFLAQFIQWLTKFIGGGTLKGLKYFFFGIVRMQAKLIQFLKNNVFNYSHKKAQVFWGVLTLIFVLKALLNLIFYVLKKFESEKEAFKRFLSQFQQPQDINNQDDDPFLTMISRSPSQEEKLGQKKLS